MSNQQNSVFYGAGDNANNQLQQSPNKNNVQIQQQFASNNLEMKGDLQNLMNGIGQEAQIKFQQQLAQLVVNKVYKQEEEKKKKEEEGVNVDGDQESCSQLLFKRCCFFLDIDFYKPYFQHVTTSAVLKRIGYSLIPFKADFFSVADNTPDLYGPLWISFTLVFALTAAGNLSLYLQADNPGHFDYKFSFVSLAFSVVFGYITIVPIFIAFMMRLFGSSQTYYLQTICIFGYSLFVFIPVSLLCTIPINLVQYCLFLYAAFNSTFFLLNNYLSKLNQLKTEDGQTDRKKIIIGLIAGIQILFMFLYKYYFFKRIYGSATQDLLGEEQDIPDLYQGINHSHKYNMTLDHSERLYKQLHGTGKHLLI
ncbi:Yip1 domain protein (macronuclear) [Tetrahymena thermophila SB210]|uniref:Protein YIPF n=1 Tax=Tetrahymena thermophila (strain SB210) TaxID=312017 RepID=Q24HH0_TETTS|nr:Yip1 domain protein [Tetrahymena thermophila SB210]EAS07261.2 Yip1 domain protein [Tetrahymena thermophila SB210]|eukprot:XP_001027503.2 Yip1 domain protein [Tetrahymena thermophila SB210]